MIGNLMPLEENLYRLCKDKPLHEKLSIYERSNFSTARNVSNRYKDNEESFTISSRSNAMANDVI